MAGADFGAGKSIVVLAIVVGCFAILWPKIFYPMMQAAFSMTTPKTETEEKPYRPPDRPPHLSPDMMGPPPYLREGGGKVEKSYMKEGRPFPHPSARQPAKPQAKTGGAMSIIMPIYTIGIVVFFLYTVLKLVFKKPSEGDKKPLIKDFHMDPDYHKFVCSQQVSKEKKSSTKTKTKVQEPVKEEETKASNEKTDAGSFDEKDYEIYKLRKKLEETENAMERIMKHMGVVSESLSNACLLKDCNAAGNVNKNVSLESLFPESLLEPFKKKMSEKSSEDNKDDKISPEVPTDPSDVDSGLASTKSTLQDGNDISETSSIQKELKRDSSVNSETSSFELLSHSLVSEPADHNSSASETDESKECENESEESENEEEEEEECVTDLSDEEENDDNDDECPEDDRTDSSPTKTVSKEKVQK